MTNLILSIVIGVLVLVGLVKLINKLPKKLHKLIIIALLLLIGFFGYKLYNTILEPIKFKEVKETRYQQVVTQLIHLRNAQQAHKQIKGKYADDINKLSQFVDTAQFALTVQSDSTVVDREKNKRFGLNPESGGYYKEIVVIDTLGFKPVKDSLFTNVDVSKLLEYNFTDTDGNAIDAPGQITLETGIYFDNDNPISIFKAVSQKSDILFDQPTKLVDQELNTQAVEGISGPEIIVGSLEEVTTSGNWPRQYAPNNE